MAPPPQKKTQNKINRQNRHQFEKYAASQHPSYAGFHSSEKLKHTGGRFLFLSPPYTGLDLTVDVKTQSLRDG